MNLWAPHTTGNMQGLKKHQIPWNLSYRYLGSSMLVLGTGPRPSVRAI